MSRLEVVDLSQAADAGDVKSLVSSTALPPSIAPASDPSANMTSLQTVMQQQGELFELDEDCDDVEAQLELLNSSIAILKNLAESGDEEALIQTQQVANLVKSKIGTVLEKVEEKAEVEEETTRQLVEETGLFLSWIEYEADDLLGRKEYLGSVLNSTTPHGLGAMTWSDGTTYHGEWFMGKTSGFGCECYPGGSVFQGQFREDSRHGLGMFLGHQNVKYMGAWYKGDRHGTALVSTLLPHGVTWRSLCTFEGDIPKTKAEIQETHPEYQKIVESVQNVAKDAQSMAGSAKQVSDDIRRKTMDGRKLKLIQELEQNVKALEQSRIQVMQEIRLIIEELAAEFSIVTQEIQRTESAMAHAKNRAITELQSILVSCQHELQLVQDEEVQLLEKVTAEETRMKQEIGKFETAEAARQWIISELEAVLSTAPEVGEILNEQIENLKRTADERAAVEAKRMEKQRILEEAKKAEEKRAAEEKARVEAERKAEEERIAEEKAAAEANKKAEEQRLADARRKEEERIRKQKAEEEIRLARKREEARKKALEEEEREKRRLQQKEEEEKAALAAKKKFALEGPVDIIKPPSITKKMAVPPPTPASFPSAPSTAQHEDQTSRFPEVRRSRSVSEKLPVEKADKHPRPRNNSLGRPKVMTQGHSLMRNRPAQVVVDHRSNSSLRERILYSPFTVPPEAIKDRQHLPEIHNALHRSHVKSKSLTTKSHREWDNNTLVRDPALRESNAIRLPVHTRRSSASDSDRAQRPNRLSKQKAEDECSDGQLTPAVTRAPSHEQEMHFLSKSRPERSSIRERRKQNGHNHPSWRWKSIATQSNSADEWTKSHPVAVLRPDSAMRHLLLSQVNLRIAHMEEAKRQQEKRKQLAEADQRSRGRSFASSRTMSHAQPPEKDIFDGHAEQESEDSGGLNNLRTAAPLAMIYGQTKKVSLAAAVKI